MRAGHLPPGGLLCRYSVRYTLQPPNLGPVHGSVQQDQPRYSVRSATVSSSTHGTDDPSRGWTQQSVRWVGTYVYYVLLLLYRTVDRQWKQFVDIGYSVSFISILERERVASMWKMVACSISFTTWFLTLAHGK